VSDVQTHPLQTVVDRYVDAWNELDAAKRVTLVEQAFVPDGRYCDPLSNVAGVAEVAAMIEAVRGQFPGYQLRRTSPVEQHHDQVRFEWELAGPDGTVAVAGVDYVALAADGRFLSVGGFFGASVPAEAAA
jgi:hypothetical protein